MVSIEFSSKSFNKVSPDYRTKFHEYLEGRATIFDTVDSLSLREVLCRIGFSSMKNREIQLKSFLEQEASGIFDSVIKKEKYSYKSQTQQRKDLTPKVADILQERLKTEAKFRDSALASEFVEASGRFLIPEISRQVKIFSETNLLTDSNNILGFLIYKASDLSQTNTYVNFWQNTDVTVGRLVNQGSRDPLTVVKSSFVVHKKIHSCILDLDYWLTKSNYYSNNLGVQQVMNDVKTQLFVHRQHLSQKALYVKNELVKHVNDGGNLIFVNKKNELLTDEQKQNNLSDINYCFEFTNAVEAFDKESQQSQTVVGAEFKQEFARILAATVEERATLLDGFKRKLQSRLINLEAVAPFSSTDLYLRPIEVKPTQDYHDLIQKIENLEQQNTLIPRAAAIGNPDVSVTDTEISSIGASTSSMPSSGGSESLNGESDIYLW